MAVKEVFEGDPEVRTRPRVGPAGSSRALGSRAEIGLTVKRVARLTKPARYLDSLGLYLQVISATNRSWLLRYELRGKKRWG